MNDDTQVMEEEAPPPYYEERPETPASKKFKAAASKRVRADSKKLKAPTPAEELAALATELPAEEVNWRIIELTNDEAYKDLDPVYSFTGSTFIYSNRYLDHSDVESLVRDLTLETAIVDKVRQGARESSNPTGTDILLRLAPKSDEQEVEAALERIAGNPDYADIKKVVAFTGVAYYFSDEHMTEARAIAQARGEELRVTIVAEVRKDSKYRAQLTKLSDLESLVADIQPGEIDEAVEGIQEIPECGDIAVLTAHDGAKYAYSKTNIADGYAQILLRAAVNDPCYTIAETVREDSRVYPRPTNTEVFKYSVFGMDRNELADDIASVLETYDDIEKLDEPSPSGDVFLFSTTYMNRDVAESKANMMRHGDS